ncbi:hypothetical protein J32TS2_26670 [Shouchella clausii]|nr:hypothetical protein J32TS2_26670 [Shouchella clausii]
MATTFILVKPAKVAELGYDLSKARKVKTGGKGNSKLSPSNYPHPDPPMSIPPVRYEPKTIEEVIRCVKEKDQQLK